MLWASEAALQVVELKGALRRLGAQGVHVGSVVTAQGSEFHGSKDLKFLAGFQISGRDMTRW